MATFTTSDVIAQVRLLIQDRKQPYRYADTDIVGVVNMTLRRIAMVRPDLFALYTTVTLATGYQQQAPGDCLRIINIHRNTGGPNINEQQLDAMDRRFTSWEQQTGAQTIDWFRDPRSPVIYYVYPPAIAGAQIDMEYAQSPPMYAVGATVTLLPDAYFPCVVDGAVWMLEASNAESSNPIRGDKFEQSFSKYLGLSLQAKKVTDSPDGGESESK